MSKQVTVEAFAVQIESFAQDKLEQIKDAAKIDRQVQIYKDKLYSAHNERFGHLEETEKGLNKTIEANPGWFVKPKSRKTTSAVYGLSQGKGSLTVTDEQAVKDYGVQEGLQFVRIKEELDKEAIKAAIGNEENKVPGAEITVPKPTGFVKLNKGLLDQAKKSAAE